jgi:predicted small metal-binding protein
MKEFRCGDIIPGCDYVTTGQSDEEIMGPVARHAGQAHGLNPVPDEIVAKVRTAIRERREPDVAAPGHSSEA